ncbi:unnamed protein product, partial [Effrenium voratum]
VGTRVSWLHRLVQVDLVAAPKSICPINGMGSIATIGSLVFWAILWPCLHFAAGAVLQTDFEHRPLLRRLLRSQVYYLLASLAGICLFCSEPLPWRDFVLLNRRPGVMETMVLGDGSSSWLLRCFSSCALVHWLLAIYEDWKARRLLAIHCEESPSAAQEQWLLQASSMLVWVYTVHHLLAVVVFAWNLASQQLPVLCCFGALFELPVCFTNLRDLMVVFHKDLEERMGRSVLPSRKVAKRWWNCTCCAVCLGRLPAVAAFLWAQAFWGQELDHLPKEAGVAFRFFGTSFTIFSLLWAAQLAADRAADLRNLQSLARVSRDFRSL